MDTTISVRPAREEDLDGLARLEREVWTRHGAPVLSRNDLAAWYAEDSPFFLVAEAEGRLCGYYFGRQIHFSPQSVAAFLDPAHVTGHGYSSHPHDPSARSAYGISVVASVPGAGAALNTAVHDILEAKRCDYFVGFTRLSMLDLYLTKLETMHGSLPYPEADIVLWYAHESARLLSLRTWDECTPKPALALAPLRRPDPVLAFHVRGTTFGLLGILPEYMPDPASRNYGALIASAFPHR